MYIYSSFKPEVLGSRVYVMVHAYLQSKHLRSCTLETSFNKKKRFWANKYVVLLRVYNVNLQSIQTGSTKVLGKFYV